VDVIIPVLAAAIFAYVGFTLFTSRGRQYAITRRFGEIVKDYGELSSRQRAGGTERLSLLKCRKDGDTFFVLEIANAGIGAKSLRHVRIDPDTMRRIAAVADL